MVDAHHHFWLEDAVAAQSWRSPGQEAIARSFEPGDLTPDLAAAGVDRTVLIQSMDNEEENRRLARFADGADAVGGVIAWCPVADPTAAPAVLDQLGEIPKLRGVRCLVGRDPLDHLLEDAVLPTFRRLASEGLAWDVVPVTSEQREVVARLARAVPDLTVVVDHLARPPVESGEWQPWADDLRRLAGEPNVVLKISVGVDVLTGWDEWQPSALTRYVDHALASFGPSRCMLASNWPVVLLRATYPVAWRDLDACVRSAGLGADELAQVRGGTAERSYRLSAR